MATTVVELNPLVIDVNRQRFHLPEGDPKLEVVVADAGAWLREAEPGSASLLLVDLYDHEAAAPVLDDESFYADCRRLLDEGGVLSVNLFGRDASFERQRGAHRRGLRRAAHLVAARHARRQHRGRGHARPPGPSVTNACGARIPSRHVSAAWACRRASGCAWCALRACRHEQSRMNPATNPCRAPRPAGSPARWTGACCSPGCAPTA
jgi:spermidine synthase